MSETLHLKLPYLEAAQAQKHVTVNDGLRALDALVQLSVTSRALNTPPSTPVEGDRYIVAAAPTGAWSAAAGEVAAFVDGMWSFFAPQMGWRAFDESAGEFVYWTGGHWVPEPSGASMVSAHGAATTLSIIEGDHTITAGTYNDTSFTIPDRAIVLGITGRVLTALGGATSWNLGVAADATRYGNGIGISAGSTVIGPSGTPVTYWGATAIRVSSVGGSFTGGAVRLAIHCLTLTGVGV
ncbi:DUF2793 domain-containing protein [Parvibaculum sedimenti]|uniref:DUF2793 domain-containing protein n=1 Tax=Parvibaculum sedimenti TaxID=2608632 RepID=A0A6N6VK23_9HYPH|nr:DUF2793 domain-containing protein [Parvibaculum sedimenti]KAB7741589.1 DUF2793 domain-containing protein [Parvibaculum sedimenti]